MCGSVSSSEQAGQLTNKKWVNSEKVGYRLTSQKMSKSMPVSKQINSVKGADGRLTKGEAKEMLLSQFQAFIRGQEGKPKYKEIFADLSEDKEKKIALEDFMVLVISLTIMSDILKDIQKAKI
nr:PREDICTED: sentan isoform X2 [Lepisosteus oculatus]